jgi:hypothetical protein
MPPCGQQRSEIRALEGPCQSANGKLRTVGRRRLAQVIHPGDKITREPRYRKKDDENDTDPCRRHFHNPLTPLGALDGILLHALLAPFLDTVSTALVFIIELPLVLSRFLRFLGTLRDGSTPNIPKFTSVPDERTSD